jgi:hypothetical protein
MYQIPRTKTLTMNNPLKWEQQKHQALQTLLAFNSTGAPLSTVSNASTNSSDQKKSARAILDDSFEEHRNAPAKQIRAYVP